MIKKSKKIFIFSSIGIGCFLLGTASILSSCSTTTSNITPPPGQTTPDEPSPPTMLPEKPTPSPTPTPPKPDKPLESLINQNSLSIKGVESKILPSMLLDEKKQNIDISKFDKNYNTAEITSETFRLIELDDLNGTISFEMSYQSTMNNSNRKFTFKFKDLMKISKTSSFYLSFIQDGNSFLSAYQYAKLLNNNIEKFLELIRFLEKENKNKFTIISDSDDIPIDYLKFNSYSISGWKESWFTSSSKLPIKYSLKDVKIKFFQKNANQTINESTINFPSNVSKEFTVNFCSAPDYVTHNIAVNSEFNEQKTSDYYWGDNRFNSSTQIGLKLSTDGWLKNYNESLEWGIATKYKVVLSDSSESVSVSPSKDLLVNVKVKVEDNSDNTVYSTISKKIIISNIKKIVEDPFTYDLTATENKFSFNQKNEKLDSNLKILESDKETIKTFVSDKNGQINITSLLIKSREKLKASVLNGMEVSFNGKPLTKNNLTKKEYYSNDDIFVESIGYNKENFQYFYNKDQDVFQVKIIPTVWLSTSYTSNNSITVNFTKPNASLSKWK